MSFLDIIPKSGTYLNYNIESIPLRVIQSNGVEATPDIKIKVTDLNDGQKHFLNISGDGDKFRVNITVNDEDTVYGDMDEDGSLVEFKLTEMLDYWIRNLTLFIVTCEAVDVPDGEYVVTGNSKRSQKHTNLSIWELEFTKFTGVPVLGFVVDNTYANSAIATYTANKEKAAAEAKKAAAKTAVKSSSSAVSKLKNCNTNQLKYSKTKKVYACVKYLQEVLKKMGYYSGAIDGWYGQMTVDAVKKFQKAYKKVNLAVDGWCGPVTLKAICGA